MSQTESGDHESGQESWVPDRCLSFVVSGPWGHFRRVEGNVVKQTYRVIPRTTVAGLVAAMLGLDRDSYYEYFRPESSAVAIEPLSELRTLNMPVNALSTAKENLTSLNPRGKVSVRLPNPTHNRQQHNYAVLVEPAYRIDLGFDGPPYEEFKETLSRGQSHYVPSLGISEHLADVEYLGEFEVDRGSPDGPVTVDSTAPGMSDDVLPDPETRWHVEQSPGVMAADDGGRTTTEFLTYAYTDGEDALRVRGNPDVHRVDGRTVAFV